jgi:hypothetical protein
MNDFQDRWLRAVEVQAPVRPERVSPWRREKNDNEMIARVRPRSHEVLFRLFVLNFYREQLELQHIQRVVQAILRSPVQALH